MINKTNYMRIFIAAITLAVLGTATSFGAGFAIIEQSVKGQGDAFSGGSTASDDASCVYFNPAGMPLTGKSEVDAGIHLIKPSFTFDNDGSTYPRLGMPVSGGDGGDAGEVALVPNLYYNQQINDKAAAGLGINAPFGLATDYDDGWVGRYHALRSELQTLNLNPSVGYSINEFVSIGGGLNAQYIHAELSSAVDFGGILASKGVAGAVPQGMDGKATIKGDDWGYGYNAGIIVTPVKDTRVGLTYRSEVTYELDGDSEFDVPAPAKALQAQNVFVDSDVSADLTVPETISLGVAQKLPKGFAVSADILWTRWSRFKELRIEYDSNQPDSVTEEDWQDTFRYALGLNYTCNEKLILRAGVAYDETPIKNSEHRTPRIPDADRTWGSIGATYMAAENIAIDAGYTHLFFNESSTDIIGSTGDNLQGTYSGSADLLALQICYSF